MKKKSALMLLCALMSVVTVGAFASCEKPDDSQTQSSVSESSTDSESSNEESNSSDSSESTDSADNSESSTDSESGDSSDDSESSSEEDVPNEDALTISSPTGVVYPYVAEAKAFLEAGEGADVADYAVEMDNAYAPIQVKWKYDAEGARKFLIEYATKEDYSDAITVEMGASKRSVDLYNLYKGSKYYLRITAVNSKGETLHTAESQFETTNLGPRVMNIDAIYNVRDLGGWDTCFGKKIVQGIAYRGGRLFLPKGSFDKQTSLTDAGKTYMSEVLGIKAELDFRNAKEATGENEVLSDSVIPGAKLTYITAGGYEDIFKGNAAEVYRQIFVYLSNKDNYPLYYHCTAGADRTGSVSYILHAFLGVSELECHQDFAFTSFSVYRNRGSQSGRGDNSDRYFNMVNMLKEYEGDNLQQKTENYLLSIGVTAEQLANIKGIFFGDIAVGGNSENSDGETPIVVSTSERTLNDMYVDASAGFMLQKKED